MDVDCDGITTSRCNSSTDPWYFDETSFQTSTNQFFTADVTHYFVIPLPSSRFNYSSAGIRPGNVGAVIYNNKVVYAVFADEGPDNIIGEASYATAQALGVDPDPATGGTEGPVTFIVFTGTVPNPVENNSVIDQVAASPPPPSSGHRRRRRRPAEPARSSGTAESASMSPVPTREQHDGSALHVQRYGRQAVDGRR